MIAGLILSIFVSVHVYAQESLGTAIYESMLKAKNRVELQKAWRIHRTYELFESVCETQESNFQIPTACYKILLAVNGRHILALNVIERMKRRYDSICQAALKKPSSIQRLERIAESSELSLICKQGVLQEIAALRYMDGDQ